MLEGKQKVIQKERDEKLEKGRLDRIQRFKVETVKMVG
jgi:hypothetical protein